MSLGTEVYATIVEETKKEFPTFEIIPKGSSKLMKAADIALRIISFNQMNSFMTSFVTTVGERVYVPHGWTERDYLARAATLRHERVHMRQKKRLGMILFMLQYFLWVLPAVFAVGRRKLEQEAYAESLRASVEYWGPSMLDDKSYREHIIGQFTGANYLWTWPFRGHLEAWYDDLVTTIRRELEPK